MFMKPRDLWEQIPTGIKHLADALSITTLLGTLAEMLPHIAATLTIIWTAIRIVETRTVQNWLRRDKS
jgi:hypothetical protein